MSDSYRGTVKARIGPEMTSTVEVEAEIRGLFAVHREITRLCEPEGWTVTHVPSGACVPGVFRTRRAARVAADAIDAILPSKGHCYSEDWVLAGRGLKKRGARAAINRALRATSLGGDWTQYTGPMDA